MNGLPPDHEQRPWQPAPGQDYYNYIPGPPPSGMNPALKAILIAVVIFVVLAVVIAIAAVIYIFALLSRESAGRDAVGQFRTFATRADVDSIYNMLSPEIKKTISRQDLEAFVQPGGRKIKRFETGVISSQTSQSGNPSSAVNEKVDYENSRDMWREYSIRLEQVNGQWLIQGFYIGPLMAYLDNDNTSVKNDERLGTFLQFKDALSSGDIDKAYELFTPAARETTSKQDLQAAATWKGRNLVNLGVSSILYTEASAKGAESMSLSGACFYGDYKDNCTFEMKLVHVNNQWYIDSFSYRRAG
ncbi:MAG TPA: hypothetical protein VH186_28100 [Chloroflexia bacterium]|nr:hypothetical protein [Chloroflexia bacterium]